MGQKTNNLKILLLTLAVFGFSLSQLGFGLSAFAQPSDDNGDGGGDVQVITEPPGGNNDGPPGPPSITGEGDAAEAAEKACEDKTDEDEKRACVQETLQKAEDACRSKPDNEKEACILSQLDADGNEDTDCQGSIGVEWIICPIYELGANATNEIFDEVIEPLMTKLPVTAERTDPFYAAWNNFRQMGNIVLVGCMLLLVYGTVRGGRQ